MSEDKQQDQSQQQLPEVVITNELSEAEKFKNDANDFFKSMHHIKYHYLV